MMRSIRREDYHRASAFVRSDELALRLEEWALREPIERNELSRIIEILGRRDPGVNEGRPDDLRDSLEDD